ncbi:hypothetical protein B1B_19551, partial [mine drainage metagenome]
MSTALSEVSTALSEVSTALSEVGASDDDESPEDTINQIMEARKMLSNASYFAFTAT